MSHFEVRPLFSSGLVLLAMFATSAIRAQETTAGLQGTVKDASGAVILTATVEITGAS